MVLPWGTVTLEEDQDPSSVDTWIQHVGPHFLTHSTPALFMFELSKRFHHTKLTQIASMNVGEVKLLLELYEDSMSSTAQTFSLQELKSQNAKLVRGIKQKAAKKVVTELKQNDKTDITLTTSLFRSQTSQQQYQQIRAREDMKLTAGVEKDGTVSIEMPDTTKHRSKKVCGVSVPVNRDVGTILRAHRKEEKSRSSKSEGGPTVLVYTDDTKTGVDIHEGVGPPVRPFGLLLDFRVQLELALQDMIGDLTFPFVPEQENKYSWISIGDGTDLSTRNVVVVGARLMGGCFSPKPSPFIPLCIFYGTESTISLVMGMLNHRRAELMGSNVILHPGSSSLSWNGTSFHAADSKWLNYGLGVKNYGESGCYLCGCRRSNFGNELLDPGFGDSELTVFDLGCRYLDTLYDMLLFIESSEDSISLERLRQLRIDLTEEHGSIRFPDEFIDNQEAQEELAIYMGESLLKLGDCAHWQESQIALVSHLFTKLLVGDSQLRGTPLEPCSSRGFSLKKTWATVPVAHDLKQILRYFTLDFLLLMLPGGKSREQAKARVLKAAEAPDFTDFFYTKSSYKMFLNDRCKWDCLPVPGRLLVKMLEIIADQAISSDVSLFNILTFSFAILLLSPVGLAITAMNILFSQGSTDAKNNKDFLQKGSLWFHTLLHCIGQMLRTRLPLFVFDEGVVDWWLGEFKRLCNGREAKTFADLERLLSMMLSRDRVFNTKQIRRRSVTKQTNFTDRPQRSKSLLLAPCFLLAPEIATAFPNFIRHCHNQEYSSMVHQLAPNWFVLSQLDPLSITASTISDLINDDECVVFAFCGDCSCSACRG